MSVAIPKHKLSESPNSRSIDINDWTIKASTNPISNAAELDALQTTLAFPLPEMTFGNNYLSLEHRPSGWKNSFTAVSALKGVKKGVLEGGDGGVKVGYSEAWLKSRTDPGSDVIPQEVNPYDWTYTSAYPGTPLAAFEDPPAPRTPSPWTLADSENPSHSIPLTELTRPDPILFYAEIPLYEDELHDNGASNLLVRIRVMPSCIFLLSRFTLRVDNVLFRTFDTRIYHSFSSPLVVRELCGMEAPYEQVKKHLPKRNDLTPLTDPNFIAKTLSELPSRISQSEGAGTKWRGIGTNREISYLHQNTEE